MPVACSQGRPESEGAHDAPSCSGFPDGERPASDSAGHSVPAESKRKRLRDEERCEDHCTNDAGQTTEEPGGLTLAIDVAFEHALTCCSQYMKRCFPDVWSQRRDSNPRPSDYKSDALPAVLRWRWLVVSAPLDESNGC